MKIDYAKLLRARRFTEFLASMPYDERRHMMLHGRPKFINQKADFAWCLDTLNRLRWGAGTE